MATLVSPGVQVQEKDLTNILVGESTSIGGVAIVAEKGPVEEIVTISNETQLVETFGKPNGSTFEWFFSAASFLKYASVLRVVRVNSGHLNATAGVGAGVGTGLLVKNSDYWYNTYADGSGAVGEWVARSAGTWGNNISVGLCPSATAYELHMGTNNLVNDAAAVEGDLSITVDDADLSGYTLNVNDIISFTSDTVGLVPVTGHEGVEYIVTAVDTSSNLVTFKQFGVFSTKGLAAAVTDDSNITRRWRYYEEFAGAPGTSTFASDRSGVGDQMHIIVLDEDGGLTGTAGTILEKWAFVSKAADARTDSGDVNYYVDVMHRSSEYIYWMDHLPAGTNWGYAAGGTTFTDVSISSSESLAGGTDDYAPTNGEKLSAYELMDDDTIDVSLIFGGPGDATHATNLIDIAEKRKDLMVFISPERADVVNVTNSNTQLNNVRSFFLNLPSTSYAVFDSGYKKMYDKYNDVFRWVPLNADVAGACAATDNENDPWWSPGGLNRGQIRASVGLAFNPTQSQRDTLYRNRINPVASFPGEGTVLWGDKTALSSNSAFSRINVRRLFNTVESVVKTAARSILFEFNDDFTRAQFIGMVEPFLRDVQGRRGITDFLVVCDETNNTGQVIDSNEFRADIYIKPARSINFITLTFVAARTGVEFSEIIS